MESVEEITSGADPGFFGGGWRVREHEPMWGSGSVAPSGVQGRCPRSGGQGAKSPEDDDIFALEGEFKQ